MVLPFRHLEAKDDILYALHDDSWKEQERSDWKDSPMIRDMGKSLLDPRMRHLIVILLLCCWIGMLTDTIDCWVSLLIKLTLSVTVGYSVPTIGHSAVPGVEVSHFWLALFRLWQMLHGIHRHSDRFWALLVYWVTLYIFYRMLQSEWRMIR